MEQAARLDNERASSPKTQPPLKSPRATQVPILDHSIPSHPTILTLHCLLRSSNIGTLYPSCLEEGGPRSMSLALAMAPAPVTLPTNSNGMSNKPNDDPSRCPPRSLSLPPSPCRIRATFPPYSFLPQSSSEPKTNGSISFSSVYFEASLTSIKLWSPCAL